MGQELSMVSPEFGIRKKWTTKYEIYPKLKGL